MIRSTVVLSLVTLLALEGCNHKALEVSPSPTPGESSEQSTTQANPTPTQEDAVGSGPPASVSKPVDPSSPDEAKSPSRSDSADTALAPESNRSTNTGSVDQSFSPGSTPLASDGNTSANATSIASANSVSNEETDSVTIQPVQSGMKDKAIVPGQKVGLVTAGTTYAQLESEFGRDRLTNEEIHIGEGNMAPSTQVALDDGYSFNVVWSDRARANPLEVRDLAPSWNIQGIHNGMSFDELKAALGDFELLGFGWDYGGTLLLENTSLAEYSGKLFIRVQPSAKATETQPEKFQAVLGDSAFPSTDSNLADLDLSVVEVVVRLD